MSPSVNAEQRITTLEMSDVSASLSTRARILGSGKDGAGMRGLDVYDLDHTDLTEVNGLFVSLSCDQIHLEARREQLERFVRQGGRMLVNGHVMRRFLSSLPIWRRWPYRNPRDLAITMVNAHPIWHGVDPADLLFRTGVPGEHTFEELERIGVAGFYGRGFYDPLPEGGRTINGLGPYRVPIDVAIPMGEGEVVLHAGLDLTGFTRAGTSTAHLTENIVSWLEGR